MRPCIAFAVVLAALCFGGRLACAQDRLRQVTLFFYGAPEGTSDLFLAERRAQAITDFGRQGFVEGRNLVISIVNAGVDPAKIERQARAVVASKPDAICVPGTEGARIFQRITRDIPVVFFNVADPIAANLVESYRRPGANLTGVSNRYFDLEGKRLELLKELKPDTRRVADLIRIRSTPTSRDSAGAAATRLGMELVVVTLDWKDEESAVRRLKEIGGDAALVGVDATSAGGAVMQYLERSRVPAVFPDDGMADAGGLLSLGSRWDDQAKRAVDLASRILRGEKPATIPVDQLAAPYMVINLATARAMGLEIPRSIRIRADRVIDDQAAR